jgi:aspartate/methionine/tyrosine aminotransferase
MTADLPAPIRAAIADLPGSKIRAVSREAHGDPDIMPLWFGEGDDRTPDFVCRAAAAAMSRGETFYAPNRGVPELVAALARYMTRLYGVPINEDRLTVTASGMNAIMLAAQCLVERGDNMVVVGPVWPNVREAVRVLGGEPRDVGLIADERGWRLDLDRLFAACDGATSAIFINSPGNPTGWMMPEEQVAAVLDFARRRRLWIVADEVYARIVYDRPFAPSFARAARPDDPVIAINSFSKSWSMTGWRLGWITAPPALGPALEKLNEFNISHPTTFVQWGGVAALEEGEAYVGALVERYRRARDLVFQRLGAMRRVRLAPPEAAFYFFFAVEGMDDSLAFARRLVHECKVGLAPGSAFGAAGEGRLRLCYATSLPKLTEALDRLQPALD